MAGRTSAPDSAFVAGCDDDDEGKASGALVLGTFVFGPSGTTTYISLLETLGAQEVDLGIATEFAGLADVWVHEHDVFVADSETLGITKYEIRDGTLVDVGTVNFTAYGVTSFGFYQNLFVSPTKSYFQNGADQIIVWNPATMEITHTFDLPTLANVDGLVPYNAYSDRASIVRGGKAYFVRYFSSTDDFFQHAPESRIFAVDIATDTVVENIAAPCPGLDYATLADDGTIYVSAWVFAVGGSAVLDHAPTCVFQIPESGEPSVAFTVADVTGGLEGGVVRSIGNGKAYLSVLDPAHGDVAAGVQAVTFGNNWRFYMLDLATKTAAPIAGLDWNGGAQYTFDIDGGRYMLVAKSDYSSTTIFDLGDGTAPTALFTTGGWSTRLFDAR